jgi:MFS family permease
MADMGRPPEQVGFVFALYAAGMFAGALAMPFLIHCLSPRNIGLIGGMQLVLAMALILFTPSMHTLLLAMLMVGTGSGMLNSSCAGHVSLTATPDTRGSIMSAYSTIFRLGQSAAPVLFGAIYQTGSFSGVFTSGLAVAAVMTVIAAYSFACADRWEHPHLHN